MAQGTNLAWDHGSKPSSSVAVVIIVKKAEEHEGIVNLNYVPLPKDAAASLSTAVFATLAKFSWVVSIKITSSEEQQHRVIASCQK